MWTFRCSHFFHKKISTHILIMEVDFCPALCVLEVGYLISNLTYKSGEQLAWVRAANQHKAIAEEIILKELIYV